MKLMAKRKILNTCTRFLAGLWSAGIILMITSCDVEKVGSTPSQDFFIPDLPGDPNAENYAENDSLEAEVYADTAEVEDFIIEDIPDAIVVEVDSLPDVETETELIEVPDETEILEDIPEVEIEIVEEPDPPESEDPVSSEGTETVAEITAPPEAGSEEEEIVTAATDLLVDDEANAEAIAAVEEDVLALVQESVPDAVPIDENATPEQVTEVAQGFADAVQESIESGEGVPAVDTAAVNDVLEAIENDETLQDLLAGFLGGDGTMNYQNIIYPIDMESLSKTFGYEECVVECNDGGDDCRDGVDSVAVVNLANCLAIDSTNYADCLFPLEPTRDICLDNNVVSFQQCSENQQVAYDNCMSLVYTEQEVCESAFLSQFDACEAQWQDAQSACVSDINWNRQVCENNVDIATGLFTNECVIGAGNERDNCYGDASNVEELCDSNAGLVLSDGLDAAALAFENLMNAVVEMLQSEDETTRALGQTLEGMGWTLYMNQCFIADEIYRFETSVCSDSLATWNFECLNVYDDNVSLCNTSEPDYEICDNNYAADQLECNSIETEEGLVCDQLFGESDDGEENTGGAQACEDAFLQSKAVCIETFGGDETANQELCNETFELNNDNCNNYYETGLGFCNAAHTAQYNFCHDDTQAEHAPCNSWENDCINTCHIIEGGG